MRWRGQRRDLRASGGAPNLARCLDAEESQTQVLFEKVENGKLRMTGVFVIDGIPLHFEALQLFDDDPNINDTGLKGNWDMYKYKPDAGNPLGGREPVVYQQLSEL